MRHPLRNLLMILSLLPCLAFLFLWVRSHHTRDWVRAHRVSQGAVLRRDRVEALTYPGVLLVTRYRTTYRRLPDGPLEGFAASLARDDGLRWDTLVPLQPWPPPRTPATRAGRMGFVFSSEASGAGFGGGDLTTTTAAAPLWALAVPAALPPLFHLRRVVRRRRRVGRGLCPACGYDLRATPGRCPECGAGTGEQGARSSGDVGTV